MPPRDSLRSTPQLEAILGAMADAVIVTDPDGTIGMINQELCRILGFEAPELQGETAASLFSHGVEALPLHGERQAELRQSGSMRNLDVFLRTKAGDEVPMAASCSAILGAEGELEGIVLLLRDMRDMHRLLAEIARAARLERERAAELADSLFLLRQTQAQLVQTGKMAAIGTLVAGLSHELNNPIGIILGYAQVLLKRYPADEASRKAIEAIERQALRCGKLVSSLEDFTRHPAATPRRVQPAAMLARLRDLMASEAHGQEAWIVLALEGDLPELEVSVADIEGALLKLIKNALEAMPAGGEIVLGGRLDTRQGRRGLELRVSDPGEGIPAERMSRIFDPFFSTKTVGVGIGLGLTIARHMIEAHGGALQLVSQPGKGTECSVWLPLSEDAAAQP